MAGVWDPNQMQMCENPGCLAFFKSHAPDATLRDTLFVYRHMKTLKYMLARWIGEPIFLPILELGAEPILTDDIVLRYRQYCHPELGKSVKEAIREAQDNQIRQCEESDDENRRNQARCMRDDFGIKVPDTDGRAYLPASVVGSD